MTDFKSKDLGEDQQNKCKEIRKKHIKHELSGQLILT